MFFFLLYQCKCVSWPPSTIVSYNKEYPYSIVQMLGDYNLSIKTNAMQGGWWYSGFYRYWKKHMEYISEGPKTTSDNTRTWVRLAQPCLQWSHLRSMLAKCSLEKRYSITFLVKAEETQQPLIYLCIFCFQALGFQILITLVTANIHQHSTYKCGQYNFRYCLLTGIVYLACVNYLE